MSRSHRALAGLTLLGLATASVAVALPVLAPQPAAARAPKNVIVLVGDGMGYQTVDLASLYEAGRQNNEVAGGPGRVHGVGPRRATQVYERFPVRVGMSTYPAGGAYDPQAAWSSFDWVRNHPTDSAAASTALAAGVKTRVGAVGLDADGRPVETVAERAERLGKSTGVVSSVPFSHATPAAFLAHNPDRNDYHGIAAEILRSDVDVVLSAGHPLYDNDHRRRAKPKYRYLSKADYDAVASGRAWTFVQTRADFDRLAAAEAPPADSAAKVFGLAQVGSTLQQRRAGGAEARPYTAPPNDVPSLATMTRAALNTLAGDRDGFFLMVEGGAIDWAASKGQPARTIEEMNDFNATARAVVEWVEAHGGWDENLVIVTADHETGYLGGPGANPRWTALTGAKGHLPAATWNSRGHTNQLVPCYARGRGALDLQRAALRRDPVRGAYLDNTDVGRVLLARYAGT